MNPELLDLAATMFGEEATGDVDNLNTIGSSILNRVESGKIKEFGGSIQEVTAKGYYAKINQNKPYQWAVSGQFPDKESEKNFKKTVQIASGLMKGTIERKKGLFYFTKDEIKNLQEGKGFNFDLVEQVGKTKNYVVLDYKKAKPKKKK